MGDLAASPLHVRIVERAVSLLHVLEASPDVHVMTDAEDLLALALLAPVLIRLLGGDARTSTDTTLEIAEQVDLRALQELL